MKKNLLLTLCAFLFVLFTGTALKSQTRLLHYWHFNNTLPLSGGGGTHFGTNKMNSDYTKPALTTGYLRFVKVPTCVSDTGYWDNLLGDSINQRVGYGSCCPPFGATLNNSAVRMRNPTDSMMFLWYIPTKNYKNIKLTWESQASSTNSGQHRMNYSFSLDSGLTYNTTSLPKLFDSAGTSWGRISLNLSAITGFNNNNKVMLRIKFSAPNTGSSGNCRFDNITVEGDSLCSPFVASNYTTTICSGGTTTLSGSGAATYTWNTNSTATSIVVSPSVTTNYTVVGTTSVGCVVSSVTTIFVTNSPVVTINSPTICSGNNVVLIANGISSYTWSTGSNTQSISVSPTTTTTYSVSGVAAGCLFNSNGNTTVTVNSNPVISVTGTSMVCAGTPVIQTASGASTYTWSSGVTSSSVSLTPSITSTYSVSGTNAAGCTSLSTFTVSISDCTGVPKNGLNPSIELYPNPVVSELTINFNNKQEESILLIYSVYGKLVYSETTKEKQILVNTANFSKGVYTVLIKINSYVSSSKFIKE